MPKDLKYSSLAQIISSTSLIFGFDFSRVTTIFFKIWNVTLMPVGDQKKSIILSWTMVDGIVVVASDARRLSAF